MTWGRTTVLLRRRPSEEQIQKYAKALMPDEDTAPPSEIELYESRRSKLYTVVHDAHIAGDHLKRARKAFGKLVVDVLFDGEPVSSAGETTYETDDEGEIHEVEEGE